MRLSWCSEKPGFPFDSLFSFHVFPTALLTHGLCIGHAQLCRETVSWYHPHVGLVRSNTQPQRGLISNRLVLFATPAAQSNTAHPKQLLKKQ